jgi:hypothetical protein
MLKATLLLGALLHAHSDPQPQAQPPNLVL